MVVATCHDNLSPCGIPQLISTADLEGYLLIES